MTTPKQKLARKMLSGSDGILIEGRWISRASLLRNEDDAELILNFYTPEKIDAEIERYQQAIKKSQDRGESIMVTHGYIHVIRDLKRMKSALSTKK